MTNVQIASTNETPLNIVWIIEGYDRVPFMMIRHCHPVWGCVNYVPEAIRFDRLAMLKAAGFTIDDPQGFVTCHCGCFKHWTQSECDVCQLEAAIAKAEHQMYNELRYGL